MTTMTESQVQLAKLEYQVRDLEEVIRCQSELLLAGFVTPKLPTYVTQLMEARRSLAMAEVRSKPTPAWAKRSA